MTNELLYRTLLKNELQQVDDLLLTIELDVPAPITEALNSLIRSGGKRLRPAIGILSAYLCGADPDRALPVAAATEMLHTATLIHDDLVDGAGIRRGIPTLNSRWSPAISVLVGDAAFAWAAQLGTRGQNLALVDHFGQTLNDICRGELNQLFRDRNRLPTREEYYNRIYSKTASLFQFTAKIGPILANRSAEEIERLGRFGRLLGIAFQMVDDVLDFVGDESTVGKPVGGDLSQGLATLPVLYYLEERPAETRILPLLSSPADPETLRAVIADIRETGALERTLGTAEGHIREALETLLGYPASPYREALEQIAAFAAHRPY